MIRPALLFTAVSALAGASHAQNCSLFCNADFDSLNITATVALYPQDSTPCWHTTSPDGIIEVWHTGYMGVTSYSGIQHVELNATQPASLYQDIPVNYSAISISFAHHGRGGVDTVGVSIGPVGGPYADLGHFGDGNAWGYHTVTAPVDPGWAPMMRVRFNSIYWGFGNPVVGNLLDAVTVCGTATTAIGELPHEGSLVLHPDPTNDVLVVDLPAGSDELVLYDAAGRAIARHRVDHLAQCVLDLQAFDPGIYVLRCSGASGPDRIRRVVKK